MSDTRALSILPSAQRSQATQIEASRVIAEVQGAIVVAQQCPRDETAALERMIDSCKQSYMAERAFFRFPKGQKYNEDTRQWEVNYVVGPTIHLARELARLWGNIQYGVKELSRDDDAGESEMLAFAWDVQTNTRTDTVFIVKHLRDKTTGSGRDKQKIQEKLTDLRDIYENNANAGARRVRERIYDVLPPWFTEKAKTQCTETNTTGGKDAKPLAERIGDLIQRFAEIGVRQEQLERKTGRQVARWTGQDVAYLIPVGRSIYQRETTVEDEFPQVRIDSDDLERVTVGAAPVIQTPAPVPASDDPAPDLEQPDGEEDDQPHQPYGWTTNTPMDWPEVTPPGAGAGSEKADNQ
jgi:hypothetical protein